MDEIVILADLGHFCAYTLSRTPLGTGKLDLIECFDSVDAHTRYSDKVSDRAGKFGQARGKNWSKGYGEPHGTQIEEEKRLIKNIARSITTLLQKTNCRHWYFAAQKSINQQIVNNLDSAVLAGLKKNIAADLTKADKAEILDRFG